MGAPIVVPFNNQPISTQKGTGTYTCPAGKYARVTVSVSGRAYVSALAGGASMQDMAISSGQFSESFDIWVSPGDTVSGTLSGASGGPSSSAANTGCVIASSATTVTVSHNATAIAQFRANVTAGFSDNSGAVACSMTFAGESSFHFFAQEYNIIS